MVVFACSACAHQIAVEESSRGTAVRCPRCAASVPVPTTTQGQPTTPGPNDRTAAVGHATPPPSAEYPATNPLIRPGAVDESSQDSEPRHDARLTVFLRPAEAPDEIGRLGGFRILRILGHGGMGVVFQAEDIKLKRNVAVKAMLPRAAADDKAGKRFLREAEAMAKVEHPHVARIYQVDEDGEVPFLAMEFLKGESLDDRLRRQGKVPVAEVVRIGREIADGLAAAHELGLVHRDIKPANIWLESPNDFVKILDFGIARPAAARSDLTESGVIVGTPAFMAPEQGRGGAVDARSDLFSLGVVLYRMATGRMPFEGPDPIATLIAIGSETPPPPRGLDIGIPPELDALIMRLLAKDPASRFQTAIETSQALTAVERLFRSRGANETAALEGGRSPDPARKRGAAWLLVPGTVLVVLGGVALAWFPRGTSPTKDPDRSAIAEKKAAVAEKASFWEQMFASPDHEWAEPENLGPIVNAGNRILCATLTADERVLVYSQDSQVWMGRRASRDVPFDEVEALPGEINLHPAENPTITGDGLILAFVSKRPGSSSDDIWMSERKSLDEPFGPPVRLPEPVNSASYERVPLLSADGLKLFVTVMGRRGIQHGEIAMFTRASRQEAFANETILPEPINTPNYDVADWYSPDELALLVTRMGTAPWEPRLFVRPKADAPFGPPIHLGSRLQPIIPGRPWISPDGQRIYFHSRVLDGQGRLGLWISRRVPKDRKGS